jgi:IS5 family transposase
LLRALLLQMLYSVRSERLLVEEIDYNILFRWFGGLNLDDPVWDATTFTKNRDRLLEAEVAKEFQARVVDWARKQGWASDEHFTVDGTLLEAWASVKSFQSKDKDKKNASPPDDPGNPTVNFHGEKRSNQTHESKSDPDALLARKSKGKEAKLSYSGNLLVENRHGLIVDSRVWEATGTAERYAALDMLQHIPRSGRATVSGDKGYDTAEFVSECRHPGHDAARSAEQGTKRRQCHRQPHYAPPGLCRQPEEEETYRRMLRLVEDHRAVAQRAASLKVDCIFSLACAAYNLVRMRNLMAATASAQ